MVILFFINKGKVMEVLSKYIHAWEILEKEEKVKIINSNNVLLREDRFEVNITFVGKENSNNPLTNIEGITKVIRE